jgi:tyrosyl-tRNA synthetase
MIKRIITMKTITDSSRIDEVLTKGVKEIFPSKDKLKELMLSGKRLRLYTGIDPTANFIHMGHMIWMKKLAEFQKLGHEVIFLIGGFTAMIGDPDKKYSREPLNKEQVRKNFENYKTDASKILDFDNKENPVKVLNNYDWLSKLTLEDWIDISSNVTLQHMLSHDMFKNRLENELPIRLHEIMYPLMQGYDSVHMEVDLEVGGSDQTFNMLTGRILSRNLKNIEKSVLTLKLLTDNSGNKMGKTTNNAISFKDSPEDVYGKIMSFSDEIVPLAYELLSAKSMEEIEEIKKKIKDEPMRIKKELAYEITELMHSKDLAAKAEDNFASVVQSKEIPKEMEEIAIEKLNLDNKPITLVDLVTLIKATESRGEAKRLITQGGVKIDQEKQVDPLSEVSLKNNLIIQVGKRKWYKLI